ncbi:alpha/beta hydrolase [Povalibacter sp.]|uniref:alpha/beta fold hydrolase n=1 Tax=Povalibacter sp. TaxID=1962978 RepID=UPI002F3E89ED
MTKPIPIERVSLPGSGLRLIADVAGPADAPRILFLHGGGQTRQSWGGALKQAAKRGYRAISVDLRGHGDSDWSPDGRYSLAQFEADIREVIRHIGGEPVVVGASLGGMMSIPIAAAPPPRVRALVLVDVTPRIEVEGTNEVMAFMESAPNGFASLDEAAAAVAAYLPHRPRPKDTGGLKKNLRLRDGRYYWHWDPAFMQMTRQAQSQIDFEGLIHLENAARAITVPTLLIRGSQSRIVSEAGAREFLKLVPHAEFVDMAGAHHMVAGDANDAFNEAVFRFIDRQVDR